MEKIIHFYLTGEKNGILENIIRNIIHGNVSFSDENIKKILLNHYITIDNLCYIMAWSNDEELIEACAEILVALMEKDVLNNDILKNIIIFSVDWRDQSISLLLKNKPSQEELEIILIFSNNRSIQEKAKKMLSQKLNK